MKQRHRRALPVAELYLICDMNGAVSVGKLAPDNSVFPDVERIAVGPSIPLPIFRGGQLRGVLALRELRPRGSGHLLSDKRLAGLKEVDDAVTADREAQRGARIVAGPS